MIGVLDREAFQCIATSANVTATSASASHTASQASVVACRMATAAAISAVSPIATYPQPDTAVKDVLRSMVWRMISRCSSAEGSGGVSGLCGVRRQGRVSAIEETLRPPQSHVKYFVTQSYSDPDPVHPRKSAAKEERHGLATVPPIPTERLLRRCHFRRCL